MPDAVNEKVDKTKKIKVIKTEEDYYEFRHISIANWFVTFMCMNIPIIGLVYLLILSFSKSQPLKREFARAYLIYQIIIILISLVFLFIFCYFGLEILDNALKLMQEL